MFQGGGPLEQKQAEKTPIVLTERYTGRGDRVWPALTPWLRNLEAGYFPGGPVVENSPSNAGDEVSIPGWRTKISHAPE